MASSSLRLIVGLGNPEKKYEKTRHNFGFCVGQRLARDCKWKFAENAAVRGLVAQGTFDHQGTIILLPLTYVNRSGVAVREFVLRKKIALENILIVCDDLNLPFGQLRLRPDGSDGGHNGLTSVIQELQTKDFSRLRLGVGRPQHKDDVVDFVLSNFEAEEQRQLPDIINHAAQCCLTWLTEGTKETMKRYNTTKGPKNE